VCLGVLDAAHFLRVGHEKTASEGHWVCAQRITGADPPKTVLRLGVTTRPNTILRTWPPCPLPPVVAEDPQPFFFQDEKKSSIHWCKANLLAAGDPSANAQALAHNLRSMETPTRNTVVLWSGWVERGSLDAAASEGPSSDAQAIMGAWSPACWDRFNTFCDALADALVQSEAAVWQAGPTIWMRPHASHVLCDAQRCLTFLNARPSSPFGLLLDPVALLVPSMLASYEDHLGRIFQTLGHHPATGALMLTNASHDPSADRLMAVALNDPDAVLALPILGCLVEEHWPADKPVILIAPDHASLAGQLDALWP